MYCYLNGKIVREANALLPLLDRGFLYGDGLFETIRIDRGTPFQLTAHLARLRQGAATIQLPVPWSDLLIRQALSKMLKANPLLPHAMVRIMVTRGVAPYGLAIPKASKPHLIMLFRKHKPPRRQDYEQGVPIIFSRWLKIDPRAFPPQLKSFHYLPQILAYEEARQKGGREALLCTAKGVVCEGTTTNVFMVREGELWTPPTSLVLPGITRRIVIDLAKRLGIVVRERCFTQQTLLHAEACFLTSTGIGILPVASIDGKKVGARVPGEITRRLKASFAIVQ